jgi:hypothetical protein
LDSNHAKSLSGGFDQERNFMNKVIALMKFFPRASAGLAFGIAGTSLAIIWWTPVIFHSSGILPVILFVATPGVSAAISGFILGKPLLAAGHVHTPTVAALRGAVTASVALLLFAPLFAFLYVWTSPPTEHWSVVALTFFVLIGSAVSVWWLAAATGALTGLVLSSLGSYGTERGPETNQN